MMNEQACIEALQSGQKESFGDLYDCYFQRIYNHIFYKTLNQSLTEDIVSDTFLRAFDKIDQFSYRSENSFRSWLYTIANNLLLDSYKKIQPASLDEGFDQLEDVNITQDQQNRYLSKQLLDQLETLGEAKKNIVVMRLRE